jgi:hypothetical protein
MLSPGCSARDVPAPPVPCSRGLTTPSDCGVLHGIVVLSACERKGTWTRVASSTYRRWDNFAKETQRRTYRPNNFFILAQRLADGADSSQCSVRGATSAVTGQTCGSPVCIDDSEGTWRHPSNVRRLQETRVSNTLDNAKKDPRGPAVRYQERPFQSGGIRVGESTSGTAFHSDRTSPHFAHWNVNRSPAVRDAHGTVSSLARSMWLLQTGQGHVQSKVATEAIDIMNTQSRNFLIFVAATYPVRNRG